MTTTEMLRPVLPGSPVVNAIFRLSITDSTRVQIDFTRLQFTFEVNYPQNSTVSSSLTHQCFRNTHFTEPHRASRRAGRSHLEEIIVVRRDSEAAQETVDHQIEVLLHTALTPGERLRRVEQQALQTHTNKNLVRTVLLSWSEVIAANTGFEGTFVQVEASKGSVDPGNTHLALQCSLCAKTVPW